MGSLFGNVFRAVTRSPLLSKIPVVGTGLALAGAATTLLSGNSGAPKLPALPGMAPGFGNTGFAGNSPYAGDRGIFQNDPNVPDWMKPAAIAKTNLKTFYRAPRGYVVMYDAVGDPYGIPRDLARKYLGWKPAKKPLLSIRDTNAIRQAGRAIKKLQNAEKMAKKIANWKSPSRTKYIETTGHVVGKKRIAA